MFDSRARLGKIQDDLGAKNLGVLFKKMIVVGLKDTVVNPKECPAAKVGQFKQKINDDSIISKKIK